VIFLPVDFERYNVAHEEIFEIIKKYAETVEPASIDEFYFSAQGGPASGWDYTVEICKKIKREIKKKLGVTCSIGIGENKLIAKIAAGMKKPDGLVIVKEKDSAKFLEPLGIRELPGIGPKTEQIFNQLEIKTVKELKELKKEKLQELLGKWGEDIYYKARGIDNSPLVENREAKSIGEQATFQHDTLNFICIGEVFENLCKNVFSRFLQSGFKTFKTIGVTVRFSDFETKTTAKTLKKPINKLGELKLEAMRLLLPYADKRKNPRKKLIRLIGVKIEKFDEQRTLI
jgi:nucleotidyltransferase/DNA polymerase involved in DNA repair